MSIKRRVNRNLNYFEISGIAKNIIEWTKYTNINIDLKATLATFANVGFLIKMRESIFNKNHYMFLICAQVENKDHIFGEIITDKDFNIIKVSTF